MFNEKELESHISEECLDSECMLCGMRDCPGGEPLHYHHDGCPSCCDDVFGKPDGICIEKDGWYRE